MNTHSSAAAGTQPDTPEPGTAAAVKRMPTWYESLWFAIAISLVAGFSFALFVMGPRPLNPSNVNWVAFDPAYHYIGWELFRQDPHLHWPLTYTDRLGYPKGESVALLDLNPLLALTLKPFSPLLPKPAQYFGIEVILCCALQFFFAFKLLRLLLGSNVAGALLGSVFFLIAPPLTYRFWGHYSLSNQWILIAALYVFARAQQPSERAVRQFVIWGAVLAAIAVGINPYLAFQVLLVLIAAAVSLVWRKRLKLTQFVGAMAVLGTAGFLVAYSFGLVITGGKGYSSGGYRDLSMNLLAPIDPRTFTSVLFHRIGSASAGQYEGYNYLGAGVLVLLAIVVALWVFRPGKLQRPDKRWLVPLALCCLLLTLLALSTKVTLGTHTLIDLDPQQHVSQYFSPLRSTGRLFWAPYYAILAAILVSPFFFLGRKWGNLLLAGLLVLQFADTQSLRDWVRTTISDEHASPLKSPIWKQLGAEHQNLIVLPAWQCAKNGSPGGPEGYRYFGFLAIEDHMRINSYQSARYTGVAQDYHCEQAPAELASQPLSPDSAYVVSPELADTIARGPSGPGKCHDVDNFILCSARTDFGLSPVLMTPQQRVEHAVANPGLEDGSIAPWSSTGTQASVSQAHVHSGSYSLATTGAGNVYQDINGLQPGRTYTLSAWVSCTSQTVTELKIFNPTNDTATGSPTINCDPGWQQLSAPFTVGGEGAIRIRLVRGPGDGAVYWDDVHISGETAP